MVNDKDILKLLKDDNQSAVRILFDLYYHGLYISALRMIYIKEAAEEIVDDVYVNIWNKRRELNIEKSIKDYLFASVRYGVLNFLRDRKKRIFYDSEEIIPLTDHETPLHFLYENETRQAIEKAIGLLPEKCRAIFLLSRNSGLSHKQIASELNISEKTVENQVGIALKKLREILSEYQ